MARIVIELSDEHKELCAAIGALVEHVTGVSDRAERVNGVETGGV